MAHQQPTRTENGIGRDESARPDESFRREGPEPPENDSGPSPSVEEAMREAERAGSRDPRRRPR